MIGWSTSRTNGRGSRRRGSMSLEVIVSITLVALVGTSFAGSLSGALTGRDAIRAEREALRTLRYLAAYSSGLCDGVAEIKDASFELSAADSVRGVRLRTLRVGGVDAYLYVFDEGVTCRKR